MTADEAIKALRAAAEPGRDAEMAAYHKVERVYLGTPNPVLNDLAMGWRRALPLDDRIALAEALWATDIHEARVTAAKLLTQARIKPDDAKVWDTLCKWLPDFDGWAIADHVCMAGQRRVVADLSRLDEVETWTTSDHLWTRRAALVVTLGLTKSNHPGEAETAARDRVLTWAATLAEDPEWFIQKAIAWWLRELSKHDAARAAGFLDAHGARLKPFARKEAGRLL